MKLLKESDLDLIMKLAPEDREILGRYIPDGGRGLAFDTDMKGWVHEFYCECEGPAVKLNWIGTYPHISLDSARMQYLYYLKEKRDEFLERIKKQESFIEAAKARGITAL